MNSAASSQTFEVDDLPPTAGLDASLTSVSLQTDIDEGNRTLNLFGPISDSGSTATAPLNQPRPSRRCHPQT